MGGILEGVAGELGGGATKPPPNEPRSYVSESTAEDLLEACGALQIAETLYASLRPRPEETFLVDQLAAAHKAAMEGWARVIRCHEVAASRNPSSAVAAMAGANHLVKVSQSAARAGAFFQNGLLLLHRLRTAEAKASRRRGGTDPGEDERAVDAPGAAAAPSERSPGAERRGIQPSPTPQIQHDTPCTPGIDTQDGSETSPRDMPAGGGDVDTIFERAPELSLEHSPDDLVQNFQSGDSVMDNRDRSPGTSGEAEYLARLREPPSEAVHGVSDALQGRRRGRFARR